MSRLRVAYGGVVFLSAFLLFLVEPMAAKQLLPVLGGSSAVWVTCLVFFQATLLLGYLYAYWLARYKTLWVHLALLAAAVLVLARSVGFSVVLESLGMPHRSIAPSSDNPVRTIFVILGATIGLPFLALASTSPLLQVWLAPREGGVVPYGLFALSNAGSLVALIAYPLLVEPRMTLASQRVTWSLGFLVYAVVSAWLAIAAGRDKEVPALRAHPTLPDKIRKDDPPAAAAAPGRGWSWLWFLLPMGAAMQLTAVTSHLSQDIAAIPLLWVLPLGVYLISFILAFELPGLYQRWLVARMLVLMLASLGYALSKVDTRMPVGLAVFFYLVEVFVACWFCHAEVYRLRPAGAEPSTVFYLFVAAGGVAGTFFVGIASPLIFRANYDLAIAFLVTAVLAAAVTWSDGWAPRMLWSTVSVLLLGLSIVLHMQFNRHAIVRTRNFYGSLRVTEANIDSESAAEGTDADGNSATGTGPVRVLMNGRIRHGMQMMTSDRRRIPTTYYGVDSGVGVALRNCCALAVGTASVRSIGVIGLGVGTIAAYAHPGDRIRFYEINPLVEPIARNLFTYLRDSPAAISLVPGDGRASLTREPPQSFDVLIVDAFSGDAIPLHLLTREAMQVYRRHLAPGGILAFHVSNSYLDLAPEIARLADDAGMEARLVESLPVPAEGDYRATWVLVSADAAFFRKPAVDATTTHIALAPTMRVWTDDYSSLLPVFRLGR